jgi:hypothetical protein
MALIPVVTAIVFIFVGTVKMRTPSLHMLCFL